MTALVIDAEIILERQDSAGEETMLPVELVADIDYTPAEPGSPVCPPSSEVFSINALFFSSVDITAILPNEFIDEVEAAFIESGARLAMSECGSTELPEPKMVGVEPYDGKDFPVSIGLEVKVGNTSVQTDFDLNAEIYPNGKLFFGSVDLSELATISGVPECGPKSKEMNSAAP